MKQIILKKNLN